MTKPGEQTQADILATLRRAKRPLSAYDILGKLRKSNAKIAPTTIYRALTALTECGRVHRLESLDAFVACKCSGYHNASVLSICGDCGSVEESNAPELLDDISSIAGQSGFAATRHVIEVHGLCAFCVGGQGAL